MVQNRVKVSGKTFDLILKTNPSLTTVCLYLRRQQLVQGDRYATQYEHELLAGRSVMLGLANPSDSYMSMPDNYDDNRMNAYGRRSAALPSAMMHLGGQQGEQSDMSRHSGRTSFMLDDIDEMSGPDSDSAKSDSYSDSMSGSHEASTRYEKAAGLYRNTGNMSESDASGDSYSSSQMTAGYGGGMNAYGDEYGRRGNFNSRLLANAPGIGYG